MLILPVTDTSFDCNDVLWLFAGIVESVVSCVLSAISVMVVLIEDIDTNLVVADFIGLDSV